MRLGWCLVAGKREGTELCPEISTNDSAPPLREGLTPVTLVAMGKSGQQMRHWLEKHQLSEWAPDEMVRRVLGLQHSLHSSAPCSGGTSPAALWDAGWTPMLPFPMGFR